MPEERLGRGAVPTLSLALNTLLTRTEAVSRRTGLIDVSAVKTMTDDLIRRSARAGKQIYEATVEPLDDGSLKDVAVLAWAGIADPGKFYRTVRDMGAVLAETRSFPDHHHFSDDEIADLVDHAAANGYQLVTTAKDIVRLEAGHGRAAELMTNSRVVEVEIRFDDPASSAKIIDAAVKAARLRNLRKSPT